MAIPKDLNKNENDKFVESSSTAGQPAIAVVNPDGSNISGGSGGGTQYTEGDTDASITGTAILWEDTSNTLRAVSATKPLPVSATLASGSEVTLDGSYIDSFGHLITGSVNNQIDIQYYRDTPANLVTVTTGSGGTATATGGMATYSATTTTNSFAKGVTNESTKYTGGAEVYSIFTAAFTGTGSGTSLQRIGLYDTNNGFFIGYEGDSFGVTKRTGGSDVTTAKASFSVDDLTGGASSKFTRNGTPEAIDLTKLNVWRIRYGWVGSAPIKFEVLSPDGEFVTFHVIKQPNLAATPSIGSSDIPVTCHVSSGNSGAALTILTNCWVAGTTQALTQMDTTLTDKTYAQLTRSVITGETSAGGGGYVNVKVNPSGSLETNVSGTVTANLSATDNAVLDAIQAAVETIDNVVSGSEAQVDVVAALPAGTNTIGKVAPNEYELAGNTTHVKKYYTNAGAVTDGIIWSPAAGKRWYITDIFINVSAAATVTLEDDLAAGDSAVWKAELAANSGWSHSFTTPLYSGEDAADLLVTTSAGNVYITVTGYEI